MQKKDIQKRNPVPTVDIVICFNESIVLIERKNTPYGWALPGGFVDYGETVEHAARREAKEETGLDISLGGLVGVYSDPARDARLHTISTVFWAYTTNIEALCAGDDAKRADLFRREDIPKSLVFDHNTIIADFYACNIKVNT